MQLRTARLCLDCEEVHDEGQCPVCASETFTYLSRWIPSDERRRRPRVEAADAAIRSPEPPSRAPGEIDAYRRLATGDVPPTAGPATAEEGGHGPGRCRGGRLVVGAQGRRSAENAQGRELRRPRLRFYIKMRACALPDMPGRSALPYCLSRSWVRLSARLARPARSRAPRRASASTATSCRSSRTTASPVTGPTRRSAKRKFHFDTQDGAFAKTRRHRPGQRGREPAGRAITEPDPEERMPPPDSGHTLTEQADRPAAPLDRRGGEMGHALGLRAAEAPGTAGDRSARAGCAIRSTSSSWRGSSAKG